MKADLEFWAVALCAMALVPMAIGVTVAYQRVDCSAYQNVTGRATRYEGFSCFVSDGKTWYSRDEYRVRGSLVHQPIEPQKPAIGPGVAAVNNDHRPVLLKGVQASGDAVAGGRN